MWESFWETDGRAADWTIRCKRPLSSQKEERCVGIISGGTLPSSPESERKGGGKILSVLQVSVSLTLQ